MIQFVYFVPEVNQMTYPSAFYYEHQKAKMDYSNKPRGTPNILLMVNGKDCWPTGLLQEWHKKTLLFADWTAGHWSISKRISVITQLIKLLNDGFTILIWQDGVYLKASSTILKDIIESDKIVAKITQSFTQQLIDTACQQFNLNSSWLHLLDDYGMEQWLDLTALPVRKIRVNDLVRTPHHTVKIFEALKRSTPPVMELIFEKESNPLVTDFLQNYMAYIPNNWQQKINSITSSNRTPSKKSMQDLSIVDWEQLDVTQASERTTVINSTTDKLTDAFYQKFPLIFSSYPDLKERALNLPDSLNMQRLLGNLSIVPQVEELTLTGTYRGNIADFLNKLPNVRRLRLDKFQISSQTVLKNLQQLDCEFIDSSSLNNLLVNAVKIEKINILCLSVTSPTLPSHSNLAHLKSLSIGNFIINSDNDVIDYVIEWCEYIDSLLLVSPMLEELNLGSKLNEKTSFKALNKVQLLQLRQFSSKIKLDLTTFRQAIIAAPQLNVLQVRVEGEELEELDELTVPMVTQLIDLNIKTNLKFLLYRLLSSNPFLQSITLNRCSGLLLSEPITLRYLRQIDIWKTSLTSASFYYLTCQSRFLHTINCYDSDIFADEWPAPLGFPELDSLSLSNSPINSRNLLHLFSNAPYLFNVKLTNTTLLDSEDWGYAFSQLPNLTELDLTGVKGLNKFIGTNLRFPNLTRITLSHSDITTDNATLLMKACPKLRIISIDGCKIDLSQPEFMAAWEKVWMSGDVEIPQGGSEDLIQKLFHEEGSIQENESGGFDLQHHQSSHLTAEPDSFHYDSTITTKCHTAITNQFCQYLILTQQPLPIHEIKEGICEALCELFCDQKWWLVIEPLLNWNGQLHALTDDLIQQFETLKSYYMDVYQSNRRIKTLYVGDRLSDVLTHTKPGSYLKFYNIWHAIAVRFMGSGQWWFYDANLGKPQPVLGVKTIEKHIKKQLGNLVTLEVAHYTPPLSGTIQNPQEFIAQGGLLTLYHHTYLIKQLGALNAINWNKEQLNSLLLRNLKGIPAWITTLEVSKLRPLTSAMLSQFVQDNPDHQRLLELSIEGLALEQKTQYLKLVNEQGDLPKKLAQQLTTTIIASSNKAYFKSKLTFAEPFKPMFKSVDDYCEVVLNEHATQRLIKLNNAADVYRLKISLEITCQQKNRPVYVIDSPSDLACSQDFVLPIGNNRGILQQGPGGDFYQFLKQNAKSNPVIIVNYSLFKAADYVQWNPLFDLIRSADGQRIPDGTLILALMNQNDPDAYDGSDFTSRFKQRIEQCPLSSAMLKEHCGDLNLRQAQEGEPTFLINLSCAQWRDKLLGRWVFHDNAFTYHEGELIKASRQSMPVEFYDAPWHRPEFYFFIVELSQKNKKVIVHNGMLIEFPQPLQCVASRPMLFSQMVFHQGYKDDAIDLNAYNYEEIYETHHYDETTQCFSALPGLIKQAANGELKLNVTYPLHPKQLEILQVECYIHNVNLILNQPTREAARSSTQLIESNDPDVFIHQWLRVQPNTLLIDVSECSPSDLLTHLTGSFNRQSFEFSFARQPGLLDSQLDNKKTIILTGLFSDELIAGISAFLIKRLKDEKAAGKVLLVMLDASKFTFMTAVNYPVSAAERRFCLREFLNHGDDPFRHEDYASKPFVYLQACLRNQRSNDPWLGLNTLPAVVDLADFNFQQSAEITQAFYQQRLTQLFNSAAINPFIVITGLTGTGKTTFMKKIFAPLVAGFYQGINSLEDWAIDPETNGLVVWVSDEANISEHQWSEFESLFAPNRAIRSGSSYLPLRNNKIVVFIVNPMDHKERSIPTLFARHGNTVVFEPMPLEVIYEDILKPIFENQMTEDEALPLVEHLLKAYQFIVKCSKTEVLMTPRDVEMIALLTLSKAKRTKSAFSLHFMKHYVYQLGRLLVPEKFAAAFDAQFKPVLPAQSQTTVRTEITALLKDVLMLRHFRQRNACNDEQRFGGLGGISLLGEPGVGKSYLIDEILLHRLGYREINWKLKPKIIPLKAYISMPASLPLDEKQQLITFAATNGVLVKPDELNSSPFAEESLNHWLMCRKENGDYVEKPGFLILATGNPTTSKGRRDQSKPLAKRFISLQLPDFTLEELEMILHKEGMPSVQVNALAEVAQQAIVCARQQGKRVPNLRDIKELAHEVVKAFKEYLPKKVQHIQTFFADPHLRRSKRLGEQNERENNKRSKNGALIF